MEPAPENAVNFGQWLRDKRKEAGLTQAQAAERAELVRQQWIRLESGESGTRYETIPRIASALGAPLAETYIQAGFPVPAYVDVSAKADDLLTRFRPGVRVQDLRRRRERLIQAVEAQGRIVYLTLRDPVTGEVERLPYVAATLPERFAILSDGNTAFRCDANLVALVAEAMRLQHAYLFNPVFATETSLIDPLPHQLVAIYGLPPDPAHLHGLPGLLSYPRLRFLLADDAGAGKTIMAGLYIREMLLRRMVRRVLIVPPAGLVGNWERELRNLFRLRFRIVESGDFRSGDNPFTDPRFDLVIISLDTLRQERVRGALADAPPFDLLICDEAHKLSARRNPDLSVDKSKRYETIEEVAARTTHLLLLTATPHMGKDDPYFYLWRLLDPEQFSTPAALYRAKKDVLQRHLLRRMKEEMVGFDGTPLFKARTSKTITYALNPDEQALYDRVTDYVQENYQRTTIGNRSSVGLALTIIQRRLASSTLALLRSLERRQERLAATLKRIEEGVLTFEQHEVEQSSLPVRDLREEKTSDEEVSRDGQEEGEWFDALISSATSARNIQELRSELDTLESLVALARATYEKKRESKFERLRDLLADHPQTKIIIFTEYRDTQDFLVQRMEGLGYAGRIATIHGGMDYQERERQAERFRTEDFPYLIATDAAGEGINLQFCWLLINYDIPWNPARLEQRMGRVHRYKQRHEVLLLSLVAEGTREGKVLKTLLDKLERIRLRLGDKVFDVIGEQLTGVSLSDLVFRASLQGEENAVVEVIDRAFDEEAVNRRLEQQKRRVAVSEVRSLLEALRRGQAAAEERRMMPAYVRGFFGKAIERLGIRYQGDLTGLFTLTEGVPEVVRRALETYPPSLQERLTFDRNAAMPTDALGPEAIYLHPNEPVFDAVTTLFLGRYGDEAERGGVFYDASAKEPYLFVLTRIAVVRPVSIEIEGEADRETLGERLIGIKVANDGALSEVPAHLLLTLEPIADPKAVSVPENLQEMVTQTTVIETFALDRYGVPLQDKLREELSERLPDREQQLMQSYNLRMSEALEQRRRLKDDVAKGVPAAKTKLDRVDQELAGLEDRRDAAIAALHEEVGRLDLAPVTIYARAAVLPLPSEEAERRRDADAEARAMRVALEYELSQGALVEDVSSLALATGYDLRSHRPGDSVRYIEVKGRNGSGGIEMTANEWGQAANHRDRYWLYTVLHCETDAPRLYRIADPFGRLLSRDGGVLINAGDIYAAAEKEEGRT